MKTKEEFEVLVSSLTELEMTDLLESCDAVMAANRWVDLRKTFADRDEVEDLEYNIGKLEYRVEELRDEIKDIKSDVMKALDFLVDGQIEKAKLKLSEI